ncbi:MAG: hypothetical protein ABWZ25_17560 [Chitinophagaceae bacterium]
MTGELKDLGWIINHKKVYRLMKEARLLYGGRIRPKPFKRNFIQFRNPRPARPLQNLSMNIKYVHIHATGRNALLLTVVDIYSRKVLTHLLKHSIRKGDVLIGSGSIDLSFPSGHQLTFHGPVPASFIKEL